MTKQIGIFVLVGWIAIVHCWTGSLTLEWSGKGDLETGWYISPYVGDINGDGSIEIVSATDHIYMVDAATGDTIWSVPIGYDLSHASEDPKASRIYSSPAVSDVDGDGKKDIVVAAYDGTIAVYDYDGYFLDGWPVTVTDGNELRALSIADLDHDGKVEIVVGATGGGSGGYQNTWVYNHNGKKRSGWPNQKSDNNGNDEVGYAARIYGASNFGIGNMDDDPETLEIISPSDVHYVCAYTHEGDVVKANSEFGSNWAWGRVPFNVYPDIEYSYTDCDSSTLSDRVRTNFNDGTATFADVDNDGVQEIVLLGVTYDCAGNAQPDNDVYFTAYIVNQDRTRWSSTNYNWSSVPIPATTPLVKENYSVINNIAKNAVPADLDGDDEKEILYSSFDGKLYAHWLDKQSHGGWPFNIQSRKPSGSSYQFSGEPVVVDLDNDGSYEVVVASWTDFSATAAGSLYVISADGYLITSVQLPYGTSGDGDGALGAPTIANIDDDANLEIVLMTYGSGLVAYEFSNSENAKIQWQTARGNWERSGNTIPPPTDGQGGYATTLGVPIIAIILQFAFTLLY